MAEREAAIEGLRKIGQAAVPALVHIIPKKMTDQIIALKRIGYPANAEAIPYLVEELKYAGSYPPKEAEIVEALILIGIPAIEELHQAIMSQAKNGLMINHIAEILLTFEAPSIGCLMPTLIHALKAGLDYDPWYYRGLMELIEKIGSPLAEAAIPILCDYCSRPFSAGVPSKLDPGSVEEFMEKAREANEEVKESALCSLSAFSSNALSSVLPTIDAATRDPSDRIRYAAIALAERIRSDADLK
ncbi:MAG: hypothetical protein ACJ8FY_28475 [Gemmataceae bacterium]